MFSRSPNISHYSRANMSLWALMALQGGIINVSGLILGKHIVSHVTGHATLLGFWAMNHKASSLTLVFALFIPLSFLIGAMISGFFIDLPLQNKRPPHYTTVFALMGLVLLSATTLALVGCFGPYAQESWRHLPLLCLLGLYSGMQNAAVSLASGLVVRTTHLTGITTDLGTGLVRFLALKKEGPPKNKEAKANLMRVMIIVCFILGCALGTALLLKWQFWALLFPTSISLILFLLMMATAKIDRV